MDDVARARWTRNRPGSDHPVDTACTAPWVSLELDPAGIVYACCANLLYPLGRIGEHRLVDIWDGPRARVLKTALLDWDLTVGCASCRWHLEHGRDAPEMAIYDPLPFEDAAPTGPVTMTFSLSNRCNLACVMCTPELSSTIRHRAGLPRLESPYDDQFFTDLEPFLPGLRHAKFLGGEPFLAPEHVRVWDLLGSTGATPRLHVTTNGTVWNDRVERLVNEFVVDLAISVDGATAPTYEAVRDGGRFDDVVTNIDRFLRASATSGAHVHLNFCLMPQTAHELFAMLAWGDELGIPVHAIVVSDPGFALYDLPTADLEDLARRWASQDQDGALDLNATEWTTQLQQLDAVLGDRRSGISAPTGQAVPAERDVLASLLDGLPAVDDAGPTTAPGDEVDRLRAWSGEGPVGICRIGEDETVTAVVAPHDRLGIDGRVTGSPVADLLAHVEQVDGRTAWLVESADVRPGLAVRSVVLADRQPARGGRGSVVRFVRTTDEHGPLLLVAEDCFYDRPAAAVEIRRTDGPSV